MRGNIGDRYEALDGLRGIAAFSVMIGHYGQILGAYWPRHMFLAVDVFFVMSGFVIAHSYGDRLRDGMPAWSYLYRRVVRLYPMFIVSLLFGAGVLYYGASRGVIDYRADDILRGLMLNALYIPFLNTAHLNLDVGQIFPADPPAWSLFLEMLASAGFIGLCGLHRKALLSISVLCYLVLTGAGIYFGRVRGGPPVDISNGFGFDTSNFLGGLPRVGFGFTVGVLLHGMARGGIGARFSAVVGRLPYQSFALYAILFAVFLFPRTLRGIYPMAMLATAVPAIVFIGAHTRTGSGLEVNAARFLGWISYPIYCLHVPVVRLLVYLRGPVNDSAYLMLTIGAAVTVVLAAVLSKLYQEPVRAALSARSPGRLSVRAPRPGQPVWAVDRTQIGARGAGSRLDDAATPATVTDPAPERDAAA